MHFISILELIFSAGTTQLMDEPTVTESVQVAKSVVA